MTGYIKDAIDRYTASLIKYLLTLPPDEFDKESETVKEMVRKYAAGELR